MPTPVHDDHPWSSEDSDRLSELRKRYPDQTWAQLAARNLFPGRSKESMQKQWEKIEQSRKASRPSGSTDNNRSSSPLTQRAASLGNVDSNHSRKRRISATNAENNTCGRARTSEADGVAEDSNFDAQSGPEVGSHGGSQPTKRADNTTESGGRANFGPTQFTIYNKQFDPRVKQPSLTPQTPPITSGMASPPRYILLAKPKRAKRRALVLPEHKKEPPPLPLIQMNPGPRT
ncbi:hypothetical protein BJX66DRAFT_344280 [Aspergillus keveii]|uniref:Myb-like domain-containing protein n=1 Tax=Aspergillus keveii TaxID=714993 RepID=A0ABR4FLQ8_9EURO